MFFFAVIFALVYYTKFPLCNQPHSSTWHPQRSSEAIATTITSEEKKWHDSDEENLQTSPAKAKVVEEVERAPHLIKCNNSMHVNVNSSKEEKHKREETILTKKANAMQQSSQSATKPREERKCQFIKLDGFQQLKSGPTNFANWKQTSFNRCAVVGSGGSLFNSNCGENIDSHDAIFRINGAPTLGFEKHVGYKKTFDVSFSPHCAREMQPTMTHIICVHGGGKGPETTLFNRIKQDHIVHFQKYELWRSIFHDFTGLRRPQDLHFYRHLTHKALKHYGIDAKAPSSGFVAIAAAFDMCQAVDIYGFDLLQGLSSEKYTLHYFDKRKGVSLKKGPHHFTAEMTQLKKRYIAKQDH